MGGCASQSPDRGIVILVMDAEATLSQAAVRWCGAPACDMWAAGCTERAAGLNRAVALAGGDEEGVRG